MISNYDVFNLGSGKGNTTLEVIKAFEEENNIELNYSLSGRRDGDVESIYANNEKAQRLLNWCPKNQLTDIVSSAWKWQQNADQ
jgi:UDP-glucose 4-epimerase